MNKRTVKLFQSNQASISGMFSVIIWSSTIPLARILCEALGSFSAGALIFLTGSILGFLNFRRRNYLLDFYRLLSLTIIIRAILFVAYVNCLYLAINLAENRTSILQVTMINYLWPSLTILFGNLINRNKVRWLFLISGVVLAHIGSFLPFLITYLSQSANQAEELGGTIPQFLAFGAAISWALFSGMAKKQQEILPDINLTPFYMCASGILMVIFQIFFYHPAKWSNVIIVLIVFMGVAPLIAYLCWDYAMRHGDITRINLFSHALPFCSLALSSFSFNLLPTGGLIASLILLFLGSVITELGTSKMQNNSLESIRAK